MIDRWIVFGGWGVDTDYLRPLFKGKIMPSDSALTSLSLLRGTGMLLPEWGELLADEFTDVLPRKPFGIAGWSTGAIMAWELARFVNPACVVCLSATPTFCRRPGFLHAQHPSMLRAMRRRLLQDHYKVLNEFYAECGIQQKYEPEFPPIYSSLDLFSGLQFLEQACLFPLQKPEFPSLFLHGTKDTVIPIEAGRYFSGTVGGAFEEYDGPHAFFVDRVAEVSDRIALFLKECNR